MARVTMLGTGLIGMFYTMTLHSQRGRDRVLAVYSRTEARARTFAGEWGIPRWTTDMTAAIEDSETDAVVIGLPNHLHLEAVEQAARAGKAVLCTKPLGRTAAEAKAMLERLFEEKLDFEFTLEIARYLSRYGTMENFLHAVNLAKELMKTELDYQELLLTRLYLNT